MDYEQKYKDALERMKSWVRGEHPECFSEAQKAAEFIFPELKESEEEKIRKKVIEVLKLNIKGAESQMQASRGVDRCFEIYACNKVIDWLDKQKNTTDKEYVFRPLAGEAIEKAAERAVKLDGKVVLTFNGAYIPVEKKELKKEP